MATVTGNIWNTYYAKASIAIDFLYASAPAVISSGAIYSGINRRTVSGLDGSFSIVLPMGNYMMILNQGVDRYLISVPDDDNSYDFIQLIVSLVTQSPTTPAGSFEPDATDVVKGIMTLATVDARVALQLSVIELPADSTALRVLPNLSTNKIAIIVGPSSSGGVVDPKILYWSATETGADNPPNLYKPNDTDALDPGRWLPFIA